MSDSPVIKRIVPGAPPPIELSKSQKRKKKATKADDATSPVGAEAVKAQEHSEPSEGAHPPGLSSRAESQAPHLLDDDQVKPSPIVDLMNKRLKATTKKIARISTYASTDIEKLNDDQVRSLKNLPTLEAIQKELAEVKKAIETHEHELAQELAVKRAEAEKAESTRISNAVSEAEASLFARFNDVLNLLRLHALLTSGIDISSLADPSEISALFAISNILIGEPEQRQSIVEQFVRGEGEFEGTKYSRLSAIIQEALNPPLAPSPVPVPDESVDEELPAPPSDDGEEEEEEEAQLPPVTVTGIPNVTSMSGSFQFIQQSEIETVVFETSSEWVEAVVPEPEMEAEGVADVAEPVPEANGNGPLDWAADEEGGLPSIAGLHAEFGKSGSVTPAETEKAAPPAAESGWPSHGEASANGDVGAAAEADDDGFTQMKGRGRGRGGYRGERGSRGGRGGERGTYRGERGSRGGRGFRGGRGGSEWRGDGERVREGDGERGSDRERGDGDGDRQREGGRGRGGRGRGEGGRGWGEGRGRGGEGRGTGRGGGERRGGRNDRRGHHHESSSPAPALA